MKLNIGLTIAFLSFVACKDILVQVQFVSRHGDRTPTSPHLIPSCPIDIRKKLNLPGGRLTPLGEYQCYLLGQSLREYYIDESSPTRINGISTLWNPNDYTFYADQISRTVRSSGSLTRAIFPEGHKIDVPPYCDSLPHSGQSVDIMMIWEEPNDRIFLEYDNCPVVYKNLQSFLQSELGQKLVMEYTEKYMVPINKATGTNYTILDLGLVQDNAMILDDHKLLCKEVEKVLEVIKEAEGVQTKMVYNNSIIKVRNAIGGTFLSYYSSIVDKHISSSSNSPRFVQFSGHDSTILNVLSALQLFEDYPDLTLNQPNFAAALIFELWKKSNEESYYVKVIYKNGFDAKMIPLALSSFGCDDGEGYCEFNNFKKMIAQKLITNTTHWCQICENETAEYCKK